MSICNPLRLENITMISVTKLTVPTPVNIGVNVTATATVKNIGTVSFSDTVTFYVGTTTICIKGTSYLSVGATENIDCVFNTSGWASGDYSVCVKTASEG